MVCLASQVGWFREEAKCFRLCCVDAGVGLDVATCASDKPKLIDKGFDRRDDAAGNRTVAAWVDLASGSWL